MIPWLTGETRKTMSAFVAVISILAMMLTAAIVVFPADTASADTGGTRNMYRLYNPNSGEHFYTANSVERDSLVHAGWRYEQIGWVAPVKSSRPVYRLYNRNAGDHHYTMNGAERNMLVRAGWKYEGIGWYSSDSVRAYPLYRQYNPRARRGTHNYTMNGAERNMLVRAGWRDEGLAWYAAGPGRRDTQYRPPARPNTTSRPSSKPTGTARPNGPLVHRGSFCKPAGAHGISDSKDHHVMVCAVSKDGRLRWRNA